MLILSKNKIIASNVIALFFRMIVILLITLYSVRLLLEILGIESYGVYTVIVSVVSMMNFFSQSMSISAQRFYSFALGKKDKDNLKDIFSLSILIFLGLAVLVLLLGETVGVWFVKNKLVIPEANLDAALWLYHFSIFSLLFTIFKIPYMAVLMAYENMRMFAFLNILENVLKLVAVLILPFFNVNLLFLYGLFLLFISIFILLIHYFVVRNKYKIARFSFYYNESLFREMISFSGWSFFGILAGITNNQGNNILINLFFGPVVNAAREIAVQVQNAVLSLSNSVYVAFKPQLIKSFAERNFDYLLSLFYISNKAIFFINLIVCTPLFLNTEIILNLWLGKSEVTNDMIIFTKLSLLFVFVFALNNPITTLIQATGNIKKYHLYVDLFVMLSLPLTYFFFSINKPAYITFVVSILIFLIAHVIRLLILKNQIKFFNINEYLKKFIIPGFFCILFLILFIITHNEIANLQFEPTIYVFIYETFYSTILLTILFYLLMLNKQEKKFIKSVLLKILKRNY